jgi:VWFA-related protein
MKFAFLLIAALAMGQSVFRSDTRAVEVTVVATRADGSVVKDLRKDEIRVFDNSREQTVTSFERMGGGAGSAASSSPRRRTIIVLDALNTGWGAQIYGREAVATVLGKLPQGDLVAILALGDELRLLHDFSNDKDSLQAAANKYDGEQPFIGVEPSRPDNRFSALVSSEELAHPGPPDPFAVANQELRLSRTLDAFTTIARRMRDFQGEKSLLWVTAGFPPPPAHQEMERAARELAAAKVKLNPVDPRGLMGSFDMTGIGIMKELAEPTGGRVFYGSNDTTALVQGALEDSRMGYVLTFAPKDYREDGSFHSLSLKTSRKGVELSYRAGYVASSSGR